MIVGIGFDIVAIARVEGMLARKEQRALNRLFTTHEQEYSLSRPRPAMHLAARLAAKEAVFKALTGSDDAKLIGWKEAEVQRGSEGPPVLKFTGRAAARAAELGVQRVHLTLSHTDDTAGAVVILER
ncbi:MAG: holo-ACP synthase [Gemmatimonadaceae bacterium]|nr:holo-ACP synthase [Gemmatimonadaceae bacterium]MCW5825832.1 holo-ACP synthase [Gemmatimonadaceae bacterium]